jgi:hypothetical protein
MTCPLTIYRDIDSTAAVIVDFRARVTTTAPPRFSGLGGFSTCLKFIDDKIMLNNRMVCHEY